MNIKFAKHATTLFGVDFRKENPRASSPYLRIYGGGTRAERKGFDADPKSPTLKAGRRQY